jgi:uncharacterized protein (DUF697 family)
MALLKRLLNSIWAVQFGDPVRMAVDADDAKESVRARAPVVWLLGKTGAGKTAVVAALTADPRARVGLGFEPCTRTAAFYDVPSEIPLVRFLDTRGIDETGYDPTEDIGWCEKQSHLLLVVMQVADPAQESVLKVLREARTRHPSWPIIVAQSGLHRLYPSGVKHPNPYPYTGGPEDKINAGLPHALRQALAHQRLMFEGLPGPKPHFVPIDFTAEEDDILPSSFGLERLCSVLEQTGFAAFEAIQFARVDAANDQIRASARVLIYGYGTAAAGAGALPIPVVGAGGLASLLAIMLRTLANRYGITWTPSAFGQFAGAIGGGALVWWALRYGLREIIKVVPLAGAFAVSGLNALAGFGVTVGLGEAACVWLSYQRRGLRAPNAEVRKAFAEGLSAGMRFAKPNTQRGALDAS